MKKTISLVLSLLLCFGLSNISAFAAVVDTEVENEVKTITVDLTAVAASTNYSKSLSQDQASSSGTGTITSIGQYVDLSSVLPSGSKIVSITMYCPTSVRVTQSTYTSINNWKISSSSGIGTNPFVITNTPTSNCKSTALAGKAANVKWLVQLEGRIISNQTGFDGFTVFGGSQMIIEYN